jgi:hypothetical protein
LPDLDVEQVQMDELFALRSAVESGEVSEQQAIKRLSRSPHWVWVAMDPVCKLILTSELELMPGTGAIKRWQPRTPAMAARLTERVRSLREVLLYRVPQWL